MKPELGVALSNLLDVIGNDNVEGQCFLCDHDSGENQKWKRKINLVLHALMVLADSCLQGTDIQQWKKCIMSLMAET